MNRGLRLSAVVALALIWGCSSDPSQPDPKPVVDKDPGFLFWEPLSFCSRDQAGADSLGLLNLGDSTIVVDVSGPEWIQDLAPTVTIPPGFYADLPFLWTQQSVPREDSIIVEAGKARVTIPVSLLSLGTPEPEPPAPPRLAFPAPGAEFTVGDTILVLWSRTDNCAPGAVYRVQVSLDSTFARLVYQTPNLTDSFAPIVTEPGDEGTAYWRVRSGNAAGFTFSAFRSWTIEGLSKPDPK